MDQERRNPETTPEWSLDPAGVILIDQILEEGQPPTAEHPELRRYYRADENWEIEVASRRGGRQMHPVDPEGLVIVTARASLPDGVAAKLAVAGDKVHLARLESQGVAVEGQEVLGRVLDSLRQAHSHFSS